MRAIVIGVACCGLKGLRMLWDPVSPNGTDWSVARWGWGDPRMVEHWDRLRQNPTPHTYTNLIVEWFEMDKEALRRGVKVFSAVILSQALLILALLVWLAT